MPVSAMVIAIFGAMIITVPVAIISPVHAFAVGLMDATACAIITSQGLTGSPEQGDEGESADDQQYFAAVPRHYVFHGLYSIVFQESR